MRPAELSDPKRSAQSLNAIILDLQRRLEKLERTVFVDMTVTSDSGGTVSKVVIAAPKWPVRAVYLAKIYNVTTNSTASLWPSVLDIDAWVATSEGIVFPTMYMPTTNTTYAITWELRG
jgi:hypothetical protein